MVDQTTMRGTPVIMAGVPVAHRILPVAFVYYEYQTLRTSQTAIEDEDRLATGRQDAAIRRSGDSSTTCWLLRRVA